LICIEGGNYDEALGLSRLPMNPLLPVLRTCLTQHVQMNPSKLKPLATSIRESIAMWEILLFATSITVQIIQSMMTASLHCLLPMLKLAEIRPFQMVVDPLKRRRSESWRGRVFCASLRAKVLLTSDGVSCDQFNWHFQGPHPYSIDCPAHRI